MMLVKTAPASMLASLVASVWIAARMSMRSAALACPASSALPSTALRMNEMSEPSFSTLLPSAPTPVFVFIASRAVCTQASRFSSPLRWSA